MPIVVKAGPNDSTNDVIREFKKQSAITNIVDRARDNQYFIKPSQIRAKKKTEMRRLKKRARSLKTQKNVSATSLQRIHERLNTQQLVKKRKTY